MDYPTSRSRRSARPPIKVSSPYFQDSSSFATGSTPTQTPYPGAEYVDLGVKVKATPTLHANHEVTLQLEFEIRALSGMNINGIPIFRIAR